MSRIRRLGERVRRFASNLLARFVPDSYRLKLKVRCLLSMYKPFELRGKSKEKRLICYYRKGSPDCPGLADRLKAMVTGYIIAAENNRPYYIYHDHGFDIQDYLVPNSVNWWIEHKDISLGLNTVARLWYTDKMVHLDESVKEYHSLCGGDITAQLFGELKDKYDFSCVFHQLFTPSARLQQLIDQTCAEYDLQEDSFVAVHIRFLDFFENVEQPTDTVYTKHASVEEQREMIGSIHQTIEKILARHAGKRVLLFSDSKTFLDAPHPGNVIVLPGKVGHIYAHAGEDDVTAKAFLDMFIISRAVHVYSIIGPDTHASGYSYMGARIGGKPFTRVERE